METTTTFTCHEPIQGEWVRRQLKRVQQQPQALPAIHKPHLPLILHSAPVCIGPF